MKQSDFRTKLSFSNQIQTLPNCLWGRFQMSGHSLTFIYSAVEVVDHLSVRLLEFAVNDWMWHDILVVGVVLFHPGVEAV